MFHTSVIEFVSFLRVQLQDPDEDDDEDRCSIVVSLMRIDRKRSPAQDKPPIGFAIYKVMRAMCLTSA